MRRSEFSGSRPATRRSIADRYIGGIQQDVMVGLNWYTEPVIRAMANYIHA